MWGLASPGVLASGVLLLLPVLKEWPRRERPGRPFEDRVRNGIKNDVKKEKLQDSLIDGPGCKVLN